MRRMASSITARGVPATVGVGPKLGLSIAHKFAHERYTVAIPARDLGRFRFLGTPPASPTLKSIPWRNLLLFPSSMLSFALNRIESMEDAFWDDEKAKRNDSFHWLISFALWHHWFL
ncbi:hypothetical protein V6N13_071112 [Hibiscus sabdariffa]|uniref:Uncharacterized protein n=1 Tax=Hibiscus sabdariffa TaxID=183260 RepID=A0ABR2TFB5_9ROSI